MSNTFDMGDMEIFDMELHVKVFKSKMDSFDMEFPCQMGIAITCKI